MNNDLLNRNYKIVRNFIWKNDAIQLGTKFAVDARSYKGDHQVENSHSVYNYGPFFNFLENKTAEIEKHTELKLLPVCCYSRVYKTGNVLKKHKDRPGCEVSMTLHLGGDTEWPIWVETPNNESVSVILEPGDALIYLGHRANHWRDSYSGSEYIQVFLHYVDANGSFTSEHNEFVNYKNSKRSH